MSVLSVSSGFLFVLPASYKKGVRGSRSATLSPCAWHLHITVQRRCSSVVIHMEKRLNAAIIQYQAFRPAIQARMPSPVVGRNSIDRGAIRSSSTYWQPEWASRMTLQALAQYPSSSLPRDVTGCIEKNRIALSKPESVRIELPQRDVSRRRHEQ